MTIATLLLFFIIVAVYILEPVFFQHLPELVKIECKTLMLKIRNYSLKRRMRRQLTRDLKRMKKDMEEFTKRGEGVK